MCAGIDFNFIYCRQRFYSFALLLYVLLTFSLQGKKRTRKRETMIQRKLAFYGFIGLLISSVLFKKLLPFFVVILVLVWIAERDYHSKWLYLKRNPVFLMLPLYYCLLALGLVHTENITYGLQKMETRLPLLLLPLILPTLKSLNYTYHKRTFIRVFVFSLFAVAAVCFSRALYLYILETNAMNRGEQRAYFYQSRYFFGSLLSEFIMHPGYLAMYVNVAVLILLDDFKKLQSQRFFFLKLLTVALLAIFVIFLYSKTGTALLLFIFMAYGLRYAFVKKKVQYVFLSLGLVFMVSAAVYFFVPNTQTRIESIKETFSSENHNPASIESTQLRIHAWKASRSVIQDRPWIGHGTGDVWDVLLAEYIKKGYTGVQIKEVNSHNEYYQTGLALGLLGIGALVFVFVFWLVVAFRKRHFPLVIWTLITASALMFESYFSTQAGAIYAGLFLFVVYSFNQKEG